MSLLFFRVGERKYVSIRTGSHVLEQYLILLKPFLNNSDDLVFLVEAGTFINYSNDLMEILVESGCLQV